MKQHHTNSKKLFSSFMAAVLVFGLFPSNALATERAQVAEKAATAPQIATASGEGVSPVAEGSGGADGSSALGAGDVIADSPASSSSSGGGSLGDLSSDSTEESSQKAEEPDISSSSEAQDDSSEKVSADAAGSGVGGADSKDALSGNPDPSKDESAEKVAAVQALIDALPADVSDVDAVSKQMAAIDEALDELTADELAKLDMSRYQSVLKALGSEQQKKLREAKEFPIDDCLDELKVTISDSNGDHVVDWKQGDSTDIDLGTIERSANLGITLKFSPNTVTENTSNNDNPTVYGDTFTCTVPDVLSNANGGKWEGLLTDTTTEYGITNGSVGTFVIENGKLSIKFDEGYVTETKGSIKNASLKFNGSFDSYGWDEESFEKTLYFGSLPIKVTFPAETAKRNITVEKAVERYGKSDFSAWNTGSQGAYALNNSPKVGSDGYVTYTIKAVADEGNTVPLANVVISDTFTSSNVDLSTITLTSVVRTAGATDTNITASVVE